MKNATNFVAGIITLVVLISNCTSSKSIHGSIDDEVIVNRILSVLTEKSLTFQAHDLKEIYLSFDRNADTILVSPFYEGSTRGHLRMGKGRNYTCVLYKEKFRVLDFGSLFDMNSKECIPIPCPIVEKQSFDSLLNAGFPPPPPPDYDPESFKFEILSHDSIVLRRVGYFNPIFD